MSWRFFISFSNNFYNLLRKKGGGGPTLEPFTWITFITFEIMKTLECTNLNYCFTKVANQLTSACIKQIWYRHYVFMFYKKLIRCHLSDSIIATGRCSRLIRTKLLYWQNYYFEWQILLQKISTGTICA